MRVTGVSTFEQKITSTGPLTLESGASGNINITPDGTGKMLFGSSGTATAQILHLSVSFAAGTIAARTTVSVTGITATGVQTGDRVFITGTDTALTAGLFVVGVATATAANTITVMMGNCTNGSISDATARNYNLLVIRP